MTYQNAELEIARFAAEDVLATSNDTVETEASTSKQGWTGPITTPDDEF